MHKGAGEKKHEAGLTLLIPRRMPNHIRAVLASCAGLLADR